MFILYIEYTVYNMSMYSVKYTLYSIYMVSIKIYDIHIIATWNNNNNKINIVFSKCLLM